MFLLIHVLHVHLTCMPHSGNSPHRQCVEGGDKEGGRGQAPRSRPPLATPTLSPLPQLCKEGLRGRGRGWGWGRGCSKV